MQEYHLVIIWNKALQKKDELINLIAQRNFVVGKIAYIWDEERAHENFAAFYGERLDNIDYKVKHCGGGEFLVILIRDNNPDYQIRKTSSGERRVNCNIFDLKTELRNYTGGGHKIHATDDQSEVNQNLASLFGKSLQEIIPEFEKGDVVYRRNVSGIDGWKTWKEMLHILNIGTKYVILRNFDTMKENKVVNHGDTDILVESRNVAKTLMLAVAQSHSKNRVNYKVCVAGEYWDIDLRYYGDGYYCEEFEARILENRIYSSELQCYIPREKEYSYSLLYHGLVHKKSVAADYLKEFERLFLTDSIDDLQKRLDEFMEKSNFVYTEPKDWSVYINRKYFSQIERMHFLKKIWIYLLDFERRVKGVFR